MAVEPVERPLVNFGMLKSQPEAIHKGMFMDVCDLFQHLPSGKPTINGQFSLALSSYVKLPEGTDKLGSMELVSSSISVPSR